MISSSSQIWKVNSTFANQLGNPSRTDQLQQKEKINQSIDVEKHATSNSHSCYKLLANESEGKLP